MRENWMELVLDDLISKNGIFCDGDWVESKDQDPDGEVRLIQLADIGDGTFRNKSKRFLTFEKALELNCTFLEKGDILLARMPDPLGRATIFPLEGNNRFVTVVDVAIIRPNTEYINTWYLLFIINSPTIRKEIEKLQSGTTRKRISRKNLSKIRFPLPPLPEQRAIVTKIETLFSELDHGIASLRTAREQLKVYRQAVLKKAFEGELTRAWREQQTDLPTAEELLAEIREEREAYYQRKLAEWEEEVREWEMGKKPGKPRKGKEAELASDQSFSIPNTWGKISVQESSLNIVDCLHSTPKFQSEGKYCVDTTCIIDGKIIWEKIRYVSEDSFIDRIRRLKPQKGDILFAREGTVGTTLVLNHEIDICLGQRMMMFRSVPLINPKFFMYFFQSNQFKRQYKPLIGGTTSPHLNIGDIKKLVFIICSPQEQHQIVAEIESRLSVCDKIEENIAQSLEKAEALRQSILKKAFEGKLLTEEELAACRREADWEPAGVLLERIRGERKMTKK